MTLGSNMTYKYEWPILITFQLFSTITLLLKSKRIHAAGVRRVIVVSFIKNPGCSRIECRRETAPPSGRVQPDEKRCVSSGAGSLWCPECSSTSRGTRCFKHHFSTDVFQIGCANFGHKSAECIPAGNKWLFTLTVAQQCSVYTGNR